MSLLLSLIDYDYTKSCVIEYDYPKSDLQHAGNEQILAIDMIVLEE